MIRLEFLSLGDLLFKKYKDSQIIIKDYFQLIGGKIPSTKNPEYYQNGTIKWINSGVLTNLYFLTDETPASKYVTEKAVQECQLAYSQINSVLLSRIQTCLDKIAWCQGQISFNHSVLNLTSKVIIGDSVWNLTSNRVLNNATLFFALRRIKWQGYITGSCFFQLTSQTLMNMKINWVSNPTIQNKLFTILNQMSQTPNNYD